MGSAWVHNMSPFLVQFTETIGIRWYGLAYLTGFVIAYFFTDLMSRRQTTPLTRDQVADFITYAAIGTLLGGRLGYAIFYSPELFVTFHSQVPYWGVLEVNKGGMASHGGMMGVILACIFFGRKAKIQATHLVDLCCFGGGIGVFFGRIANFINGELYGRECAATLWMAVKFPKEIYTWGLAEIDKLKGLSAAVEALGAITTPTGEKISATASDWLAWVNSMNAEAYHKIDLYREAIDLATQKHNQAVIAALAPVLTPRYPSQLIQAFVEGLAVVLILAWFWRKPRKPGVISAIFGVLYSIARIIGEQFRLPDYDIGYQALGLTRGQWLSIGLLCGALIYLWVVVKRDAKPMGGWNRAL